MFALVALIPRDAGDEVFRWLGNVVAAVLIGWVAYLIQQGGRRRRERREIREELELVQQLEKDDDPELVDERERLRRRVRGLVVGYTPHAGESPSTEDWEPVTNFEFVLLTLMGGTFAALISSLIASPLDLPLTYSTAFGVFAWLGFWTNVFVRRLRRGAPNPPTGHRPGASQ